MEWVETTAKTVDEAKSAALDQLGVAADEAEFDVLEEPRPGLFGRVRGGARVRARVMPTPARPKKERRRGSSRRREAAAQSARTPDPNGKEKRAENGAPSESSTRSETADAGETRRERDSARSNRGSRSRGGDNRRKMAMDDEEMMSEETVSPQEVGDAAVAFVDGLVNAFGVGGSTRLSVDDIELDVAVDGDDLGLMVGPRGRTLLAIQDLARVSAQRRLGDHTTRLRVDVGGYRARRATALASFAAQVAGQVRDSGVARSLEPMVSADRKVIHDALTDEPGVESRSEGDDPNRYVVVSPA